jgi:hypothetical protein
LSESKQKGRTACQPESASFRPALLLKLELFPSEFLYFPGYVERERTKPTLWPSQSARIFHDWRERIRVCEIHQMNCFDDDLCLLRILVWGMVFALKSLMSF